MYGFIHFRVRDVMTRDPVAISKEVTLIQAAEIFERHDFNGLPVVDGEHRLLGMVTKLDFLKAFVFTERSKMPRYDAILAQPVLTILNTHPRAVSPDAPLTRVAQEMIDTRYKSFPVVEGDRLIGMIAREDILKALRKAAQGEGPEAVAPGS